MLVNLDTHYLIMEFISWEQLFLCKQVAKDWNEVPVKDVFRPTTLHGMPAWVLMYAWFYSHAKEVELKPMTAVSKHIKPVWTSFIQSQMNQRIINKKYFRELFKRIKKLDTTEMSYKSQVFLLQSKFLKNLQLKYLTVNYWLIHFLRAINWFGEVERLVVVTELPQLDLFDSCDGGKYKELRVVTLIKTRTPVRRNGRCLKYTQKVVAPDYIFGFSETPLWYQDYELLYLRDARGIYTRNSKKEPFVFVDHKQSSEQRGEKRELLETENKESHKKQKV
jgi:hypothetical protein